MHAHVIAAVISVSTVTRRCNTPDGSLQDEQWESVVSVGQDLLPLINSFAHSNIFANCKKPCGRLSHLTPSHLRLSSCMLVMEGRAHVAVR